MHHQRAWRVLVFGLLAVSAMALYPAWAAEGQTPILAPPPAPAATAAPAPATPATPAPPPAPATADDSTVVAKIGETDTITKGELDRSIAALRQSQMMQARARGIDPSAVPEPTQAQKMQFLDDMISTRVLFILAKNSGITVSDADVDADIEQNKSHLPTGVTFDDYLKKQGLSLETVRENIRRRIMVTRFQDEQSKDLAVTDKEIADEYTRAQQRGVFDAVDFQHIMIRVEGADDAAWAKGKEAIDAAYKRIKDGEDFGKVAQEVSQDSETKDKGGVYTEVPHNPRRPELDKVLFSTKVGEMAEPFKSPAGWHLVKVNKRGPVSQEKAAETIRTFILRAKKQETMKKIVDEARSKMSIQITMPAESAAPAAPAADASKLLDKAI